MPAFRPRPARAAPRTPAGRPRTPRPPGRRPGTGWRTSPSRRPPPPIRWPPVPPAGPCSGWRPGWQAARPHQGEHEGGHPDEELLGVQRPRGPAGEVIAGAQHEDAAWDLWQKHVEKVVSEKEPAKIGRLGKILRSAEGAKPSTRRTSACGRTWRGTRAPRPWRRPPQTRGALRLQRRRGRARGRLWSSMDGRGSPAASSAPRRPATRRRRSGCCSRRRSGRAARRPTRAAWWGPPRLRARVPEVQGPSAGRLGRRRRVQAARPPAAGSPWAPRASLGPSPCPGERAPARRQDQRGGDLRRGVATRREPSPARAVRRRPAGPRPAAEGRAGANPPRAGVSRGGDRPRELPAHRRVAPALPGVRTGAAGGRRHPLRTRAGLRGPHAAAHLLRHLRPDGPDRRHDGDGGGQGGAGAPGAAGGAGTGGGDPGRARQRVPHPGRPRPPQARPLRQAADEREHRRAGGPVPGALRGGRVRQERRLSQSSAPLEEAPPTAEEDVLAEGLPRATSLGKRTERAEPPTGEGPSTSMATSPTHEAAAVAEDEQLPNKRKQPRPSYEQAGPGGRRKGGGGPGDVRSDLHPEANWTASAATSSGPRGSCRVDG